MRIGQNPAKYGLPAYSPKEVGVGVLTHIPSLDGYFKDLLDVLTLQIASLHRNTGVSFDLCVFDNGSAPEVRTRLQSLQEQGWITWLVLSRENMGKTGAMNWMLMAMPNEWLVFADGDVLFRPGWWEETQRIFQAFPEAAMVSAQPAFFDVLRRKSQDQFTQQDQYEVVYQVLEEAVREEYARGLGRAVKELPYLEKPLQILRAKGTAAVLGATHMQFTTRKAFVRELFPLPSSFALNRDEDRVLHQRVEERGWLQLSTLRNYVLHMGNRIDRNLLEEVEAMGLQQILSPPQRSRIAIEGKGLKHREALRFLVMLSRFPGVDALARRLYNFLYSYFALRNK
ncbi:glycosyltransferase family 2 protein [Candidatus Parcubacteria bacterium]|nr:MAG: glycosyltransferase family 2 protein [Candidatus Parcubacteria bacterium]